MDEFFQKLREIQKKERNTSGLAEVGDNFYKDVHNYLNKLIMKIGNNPFSFESYLLRDARRIATEICERREHKITNSALMNIQRSYRLFDEKSEKSKLNSPALPPSNLTPEEEDLYYSLVKPLSKYRKGMKSPLKSFKVEKVESEIKSSEIEEHKPSLQSANENVGTGKTKKPAPLGIEQDIANFHAYEQPVFEMPEVEPESVEKEIENTAEDQKSQIRTLMVLEELPSIMGVDNEIYGPLSPQDIITMPEPNAQILIKNNKGKFIKKYKKITYR